MTIYQQLFNNTRRDMQRVVSTLENTFAGTKVPFVGTSRNLYPPTDTIETEDHYELESELPGYKKKDIKIEVIDRNTLVLTGSLAEEESDQSESEDHEHDASSSSAAAASPPLPHVHYLTMERNVADYFSRAFTFPSPIQADGIKARFEDGILKVIVPKSGNSQAQQVNIE
ncbi:HSP20-like chaperone [Pilaira anomala]|nr:HSP20-like chaperone [Pilaira anomala]